MSLSIAKNVKFTVIPAIDILGGVCVRLEQGDYGKGTTYSDDPISQALRWRDNGAEFLHLVDLDGAKKGFPANIEIIRKIVEAVGIPCEVGGGIRSYEDAVRLLEAGVERIIFGTAAVKNPDLIARILQDFPDKTVLGIDAKNGRVAISGWLDVQNEKALDISAKFAKMGVRRFIYTDISTDGMLSGPNYAEISAFCDKVPEAKVIASGGVSSSGNIRKLIDLHKNNLEGVIVGKALYSGKITLKNGVFE